jgi:DNA-binding CsgD family transcriptional regulator
MNSNEIPDGMHTAKVPNTMSQDLDMMFLKSSGELVTFFQSKKDMAHYYLEQMKKYKLSDREEEILTYVLSGITRKEILVKLDIEMSTLKTHLNNLYKKLPAHWAQMLKARAY